MHLPCGLAGSVRPLFAGLLLIAGVAGAQSYPSKAIRLTVGFTPGSGADIVARTIGDRMVESLGQPVIIENRPGAGGSLATERVLQSPPDGYNLLLLTSSAPIQIALKGSQLRHNLETDIAPVSLAVIGPLLVITHPSVPARDIRQLLALARAQPGVLAYGSSGVGSSAHLAAAMMASMAKLKLVHVPYKGSSEAVIGVTTGEVAIGFPSAASALSLIAAGRLRALAITTEERVPFLPDIPTLGESGIKGYDFTIWYSVVAPAGTPRSIVQRLNDAIVKAAGQPALQSEINRQGLAPKASTPEQLGEFIKKEIAKSVKLIDATGIKAE
jgi:tripartite-type tricarboxylate transporter receptor subunit TctC